MQEKLTIARPYASAAYAYARDSQQVAQWSEMLSGLAAVVQHPEMQPLIGHPKVPTAELFDLIKSALGSNLDIKHENFVQVLLDADRIRLAPEVAELFEREKTKSEGVVDVMVVSAYPIEAAQQSRISEAIRARTGKDCEIRSEEDQSLIGGAVIRVGDSVIDLSLKGRLQALTQRLS
ncbi:MAG: F0F1 ATP synthase subunit delta [Gammaproteobacteria bacterium]